MYDPKMIADEADVIIDGYAFIEKDEGRITVVNLNREGHAALVFPSGEVVESSMDEIELAIAMDYLNRAKAYMEDSHAQVFHPSAALLLPRLLLPNSLKKHPCLSHTPVL